MIRDHSYPLSWFVIVGFETIIGLGLTLWITSMTTLRAGIDHIEFIQSIVAPRPSDLFRRMRCLTFNYDGERGTIYTEGINARP
jgi:hypothetical protein